jgi:hypothetical protein
MIKRKLKYSVHKNNFGKGYYGTIHSRDTDLESFLQYYRNLFSNSRFNEFTHELKKYLREHILSGSKINIFDMFIIHSKLKGIFDNPDDLFDPDRHSIELSICCGNEFNELISNNNPKLKKVDTTSRTRKR